MSPERKWTPRNQLTDSDQKEYLTTVLEKRGKLLGVLESKARRLEEKRKTTRDPLSLSDLKALGQLRDLMVKVPASIARTEVHQALVEERITLGAVARADKYCQQVGIKQRYVRQVEHFFQTGVLTADEAEEARSALRSFMALPGRDPQLKVDLRVRQQRLEAERKTQPVVAEVEKVAVAPGSKEAVAPAAENQPKAVVLEQVIATPEVVEKPAELPLLEINRHTNDITVSDRKLTLSRYEQESLLLLARKVPNAVMPDEIRAVALQAGSKDQKPSNVIGRLRGKIETDPKKPEIIAPGQNRLGYRLVAQVRFVEEVPQVRPEIKPEAKPLVQPKAKEVKAKEEERVIGSRIKFNLDSGEIWVDEVGKMPLAKLQRQLFYFLALKVGQDIQTSQLAQAARDIGLKTKVRDHVRKLREKIETDLHQPEIILCSGGGRKATYRLNSQEITFQHQLLDGRVLETPSPIMSEYLRLLTKTSPTNRIDVNYLSEVVYGDSSRESKHLVYAYFATIRKKFLPPDLKLLVEGGACWLEKVVAEEKPSVKAEKEKRPEFWRLPLLSSRQEALSLILDNSNAPLNEVIKVLGPSKKGKALLPQQTLWALENAVTLVYFRKTKGVVETQELDLWKRIRAQIGGRNDLQAARLFKQQIMTWYRPALEAWQKAKGIVVEVPVEAVSVLSDDEAALLAAILWHRQEFLLDHGFESLPKELVFELTQGGRFPFGTDNGEMNKLRTQALTKIKTIIKDKGRLDELCDLHSSDKQSLIICFLLAESKPGSLELLEQVLTEPLETYYQTGEDGLVRDFWQEFRARLSRDMGLETIDVQPAPVAESPSVEAPPTKKEQAQRVEKVPLEQIIGQNVEAILNEIKSKQIRSGDTFTQDQLSRHFPVLKSDFVKRIREKRWIRPAVGRDGVHPVFNVGEVALLLYIARYGNNLNSRQKKDLKEVIEKEVRQKFETKNGDSGK